jgi:serine/threonine protein kinase/TPR repeat protein
MTAPTLLGKYEVRREIGRGSMGVVYEGFDPLIDRVVALKVLQFDDASPDAGQELRLRFRREAQAAGRLSHPGIVAIYDYGEVYERRCAYIAMELVEGQDLRTLLAQGRRFSVDETMRVAGQLLSALQHAHDRKVVHRDIKPANILLLPDGGIKIADFGIAKFESSELTQAGAFMGTVSHMSPEQLFGHAVDKRTDIFSSAVVLYQMFTGTPAFSGSAATVIQKILNATPQAPSALAAQLPQALDRVLLKAMAKQPDDRYPSADAFRQALAAAFEAPHDDDDDGDRTVIQRARPLSAPVPPPRPAPAPVVLPPQPERVEPPVSRPVPAPQPISRDEPPPPPSAPSGPQVSARRPGLGALPKAGVAAGVTAAVAALVWGLAGRPATSPAPTPGSPAPPASAPVLASAASSVPAESGPAPVPPPPTAPPSAPATQPPVPAVVAAASKPAGPAASAVDAAAAAERKAWDEALRLDRAEAYARFIRAYPKSTFLAEAQRRRTALERAAQTAAAPASKPAPAGATASGSATQRPTTTAASPAPADSPTGCLEEARRGDLRCQLTLAANLRHGRGMPANPAEALRWYRQAADQGSAQAQAELAAMYAGGQGTERNEAQALAWAEKAGAQGVASAQHLAGMLYVERGRADPAQYEKAVEWYQKAAAQGLPVAMAGLANLTWYGRGTARDPDKAIDHWKAACDRNFVSSCFVLGQLYEAGSRANPEEALRYYRKSVAVPGLGEADRAKAQAQIERAR